MDLSALDPILNQLKDISLGGNTAYDYVIALVIFVGLLVILKVFQMIILARLEKVAKRSKTEFDDTVINIFDGIKPPFYLLVALYFSIQYLVLHPVAEKAVSVIFLVVITYEIVQAVEKIIDYGLRVYTRKTREAGESVEHSKSMVSSIRLIVRVILWIFGFIMILANLDVNVTSLVASLGIGGIAIALALQNVLGDMFNSFSLYIDKPFKVGDMIKIGKDMGTVERIGMKTTRIRTLQGEEMVVSNTELTSTRVQNFKKMKERRVIFNLGVVYGTSSEKLEAIPKMIKEIVDLVDGVDYDRCNFDEYGDFSLNFQTVFFVKSADYKDYMNKKEEANLAIYKRFEKEGIEFAYPTQTLYVNKS
jgi:small-conductance mechanosensitive channel